MIMFIYYPKPKQMKISKHLLMLFLIQLFLVGCETDLSYLKKLEDSELVQANVKNLTDIIVYDIFSPPVASRVYLYPAIAAYQTMQLANQENYASLSGQVKGLSPLPKPSSEKVNYNIASLHAFNEVGKALIFSEDKMTLFQENLDQDLKERGVPGSVLKASRKYGEVVADHILAWAKAIYIIKQEPIQNIPSKKKNIIGNQPHQTIWTELNRIGKKLERWLWTLPINFRLSPH